MSCESKSALRSDSGASDVAQLARENHHTEAAEWASTHASPTPLFARDGSDGAHLATEEAVPRVSQPATSFYSSSCELTPSHIEGRHVCPITTHTHHPHALTHTHSLNQSAGPPYPPKPPSYPPPGTAVAAAKAAALALADQQQQQQQNTRPPQSAIAQGPQRGRYSQRALPYPPKPPSYPPPGTAVAAAKAAALALADQQQQQQQNTRPPQSAIAQGPQRGRYPSSSPPPSPRIEALSEPHIPMDIDAILSAESSAVGRILVERGTTTAQLRANYQRQQAEANERLAAQQRELLETQRRQDAQFEALLSRIAAETDGQGPVNAAGSAAPGSA